MAAQSPSSLSGVVTDASSNGVLSDVRVTAVQEGLSTLTDWEGRFALSGLNPASTVIRLQLDGYATAVQEVRLRPAPPAPVAFSLTPFVEALQELMVGASPAPPRRDLRRGASRLTLPDPRTGEMHGSVADFLQSQAGLNIRRNGTRTTGVLTRGISTVHNNNPLVFLDGVRLTGMEILDEVPLSHVSSIELIRGPEGLNYGFGSGHGVIVIRTR